MEKIIYLDNNATTKVDERVIEAMTPYYTDFWGNPSSIYSFGGKLSKDLKDAREKVKELIGANDQREIFFTASGSESANMAIKGAIDNAKGKNRIVTTKVEHPCVLNLYRHLEKQGYEVVYLGVNSDGDLDLQEVEASIDDNTVLISVMMANNESGIIFPVSKIADIVKRKNSTTKVFVDAVQAAGKIDIDVKNTQIDLLAISGHKFHAPKGVGALYVKSGVLISPLIIGGHQERGKRAGTENVAGIIAIATAAELAKSYLTDEATRVKAMRDRLESGILKNIYNAKLNSSLMNRVPNTTNIGFEYVEGELILLHLSDLGICASSGSACTSGSLEPSHVLKAMGVPFTALHGSIRFSLSRFTTEEEIDYTLKVLPGIIEKLATLSPFQKELEQLKAVKKSA